MDWQKLANSITKLPGFAGTTAGAPLQGIGFGGVPPLTAGTTATTTAANTKAATDAKTLGYINDQVAGTTAGENQSGNVAGTGYQTQGENLQNTLQQGQTGINEARKGVGVSQINSIKALIDQIHQGLHGSTVTLGNGNALDSSAADAVGRIYTQYGNTQRNVINNDAAVKNASQDVAQGNLDLQRTVGLHGLDSWKQQTIDQIANDTTQKLSSIDGIAQLQGLSGKVDVQGIKQQVVEHAQQKIAEADAYIKSLIGGIAPTSADDIGKQAYALSNAGVSGSTALPFQQVATSPTAALGGATTTQLPLYLKPKNKT